MGPNIHKGWVKLHEIKKEKSNIEIKFWNILLEHFIERKPLIYEE